MRKFQMILLSIGLSLLASEICFSQVLEDYGIIPLFRKYSDKVDWFRILEMKFTEHDYSVMTVEATPSKFQSYNTWDEIKKTEVFGVFLVSVFSGKCLAVLDIFYTEETGSMIYLDSVTDSTAVISKVGLGYGRKYGKVKYFFDHDRGKLIKAIRFDNCEVTTISTCNGSLFFTVSNGHKSTQFLLKNLSDYERVDAYEISDSIKATTSKDKTQFAQAQDSLYNGVISTLSIQFIEGSSRVLYRGFRVGDRQRTIDYLLPSQTLKMLKQYRPDQVDLDSHDWKQTIEDSISFPIEFYDWEWNGARIWFGNDFYAGEGSTGIGGIGYFDFLSREYRMYYPKEVVDYSISKIYTDGKTVLTGLVEHTEGTDIPEGFAVFDIQTEQCKKYLIPEMVTSACTCDSMYFVGSTDGLFVIDHEDLTHIGFDFDINQKYSVYIDKKCK